MKGDIVAPPGQDVFAQSQETQAALLPTHEKVVVLWSQMLWSTKLSQLVGGWDASRGLLRQETLFNRVLMKRFSPS